MSDSELSIRKLSDAEIERLKSQGCIAKNWDDINIHSDLDLGNILHVYFSAPVVIMHGVALRNIPGGIGGCTIRENATVENVASIEFDNESTHGVGTMVSVLDETGSRSVPIYPGLSSQVATLMAREPEWAKKNLSETLGSFIDSRVTPSEIGASAVVKNCGSIKNVSIGAEIVVDGASRLVNGSLINNAAPGKCFTSIGAGVEAENFILEDARLSSKTLLHNVYVGQGCEMSQGFSAHDSLFFSNCNMENGEAHSLLAGPYTVSMHKGTLLIGCQTSFMNAGSLTNQSNHMYKLGPVHWGLMERGVKTSSGSYVMLGAKIGAFSLLMGSHKTHPDSSEFPFSYLFGDERGSTVVVPGLMLRSCGLLRDENKWPMRDRRLNRGLPLFDRITFNVFNPFTVETMLRAIEAIDDLLSQPADDDFYVRYKGMKFTRAALERARNLYQLAISKYLFTILEGNTIPESDGVKAQEWIDLGGLVMPREFLDMALKTESVMEAESVFTEAFENYRDLQIKWISRRFVGDIRKSAEQIQEDVVNFDKMVEEDRQDYLEMLDKEARMLLL